MNATTPALRLVIKPAPDGADLSPITFADFAAANADGFTPAELNAMRDKIARGEPVPLNMGAGGVFTLEPIP